MVLIQDRRNLNRSSNGRIRSGIFFDAVRHKTTTRRGSNPARSLDVCMEHEQRAETRPHRYAKRCGRGFRPTFCVPCDLLRLFPLLSLRLCVFA